MIGKNVYHPKYGKGEIVDTRYKGLEYLVLFQIGIKKWVRFDEVQFESENRLNEVNVKNNENLKERSIIEALRLGIVPYRYVEEFTFGRDEEIEKLRNWLLGGKSNNLFFIIGEYGSGKTHLINYLEAVALKEGFATSLVELDLNEAPFFRPKRVYREIIKSFKYPKSNGSLGEFRSFIKDALKLGYLNDHPYFKYLEKDDELIWEWIEAKGSNTSFTAIIANQWDDYLNFLSLPPLSDYSTFMNVYCNLISTISWVAREAFNLKGFLLIFDEAESINDASSDQRKKSVKFINALWYLAMNDERLLSTKLAKDLGFDTPQNLRASRIPYIYKLPFNLKVVLAFTFPILTSRELDISIPYVKLEKLPTEVLEEIFWYIWEIYQKAYDIRRDVSPWYILDKLLEKESITRLFIKGTVEAFDLLTFENKRFMRKYGFL